MFGFLGCLFHSFGYVIINLYFVDNVLRWCFFFNWISWLDYYLWVIVILYKCFFTEFELKFGWLWLLVLYWNKGYLEICSVWIEHNFFHDNVISFMEKEMGFRCLDVYLMVELCVWSWFFWTCNEQFLFTYLINNL